MPQPDWKRVLETGMNFTEVRREQAHRIASELVSQGQLARDQLGAAVDEIVDVSRRRSEEFRTAVRTEVRRQLRVLGIAGKEAVNGRSARPRPATTKPAAKKPATKPATKAAKKPAAKKRATKATKPAKKAAAKKRATKATKPAKKAAKKPAAKTAAKKAGVTKRAR